MSRPCRSADRQQDAIAVGSPALSVAAEDREQLEDLVAELLIAAIEREEGGAS